MCTCHNRRTRPFLPSPAPVVSQYCVRTCSPTHCTIGKILCEQFMCEEIFSRMCVIMFVHMCQNVFSHTRPVLPSPAPVISQCERTCSPSQEIEWLKASCTSERRRCVGSSCVRICSSICENMFSHTLQLWDDIVWPFNAWERVLPHKNFAALKCVM